MIGGPLPKWIGGLSFIALLIGSEAAAQTPTVPIRHIGPCGIVGDALKAPTSQLTRLYHSGVWAPFEEKARALLDAVKLTGCGDVPDEIDASIDLPKHDTDFVILMWRGRPPVGDPTLFVAVVTPVGYGGPQPGYSLRLPGFSPESQRRLFQVFVSDAPRDTLASVYVSTEQRNPLSDQLPALAASMVDPLLALASQNQGDLLKARGTQLADAIGWVTLSQVQLPFRRAAIQLHLRSTTPPTGDQIGSDAADLRDELMVMDARYSECAIGLAEDFKMVIDGEKRTCANAESGAACLLAISPKLSTKYGAAMAACGAPESNAKALQTVDQKFREFLLSIGPKTTPAKVDIHNTPPERFSFGVASGILLGGHPLRTRVKIDGGNVVADPLSRQLSMVVVNVALKPFDPAFVGTSEAERKRVFFGTVVAPSFGVGGGYSYLFTRGLAVNAGLVILGTNAAKKGQPIGEPPVDERDPFRLGGTWGWFIGASYNLK